MKMKGAEWSRSLGMLLSILQPILGSIMIQADVAELRKMYPHARPSMGVIFHERHHAAHPTSSFQEMMFVTPIPKFKRFEPIPRVRICGTKGDREGR